MEKKKIVITFSYYGIGGAQRRAINLANEFAKTGYDVKIVAIYGADKSISEEKFYDIEKGIDIIMLPEIIEKKEYDSVCNDIKKTNATKIKILKRIQYFTKYNKFLNRKINWQIRKIKNSENLNVFLSKHRKSIVICFGFNILDRVYMAAKKCNCKLVFAETNSSKKYQNEEYYNDLFRLVKKANAWVFQTKEQKSYHNINDENAVVIHNPLMKNLPKAYSGIRTNNITTFCRISPQKNLELLLRAFYRIHNKYPTHKLYIYGDSAENSTNEYRKSLVQYINKHKLNNCVFLEKNISSIHSTIKKDLMFVSTSDYEGISNSMIEAMAIGMPCICTDCDGGGAREFIYHKYNGLLVPVGNEDALVMAIEEMITNNDLRNTCADNATKIREQLAINKIFYEWKKLIENI